MITPDAALPDDARLYGFRHYKSVFSMPEWGSLAQWKKERQNIRQHLWLCAGLNDQTMAFQARGRVIGQFEHEGILIENISIETLPGLYVQGNLYRPLKSKKRLPLILNPHGHGMSSRTLGTPIRAMNQAFLGFAAFAWSMTGHEKDTMQLEHRTLLSGKEKLICNVLGLSMFGIQLNNAIKVLDYLCDRDDIDARRIGCTGSSGGGTQTYFLAAVDDRVKVSAPAVMLSGHYQGGCVCENAPLLHLKYSTIHYAALTAPRPLFLTGCTGDWTHHLVERECASLRELYRLYGKEGAIECFYQDENHNYNQASREPVYAWMKRWLMDDSFVEERIPELDKPIPAQEKLFVFNTPIPPYQNAIMSPKELIDMWTGLHTKPDKANNAADAFGLSVPNADDLLIRVMTPRYAYRSKDLSQNRIDYGRFSEDSYLTCRFVLPDRGKRCFLIVRNWKDEAAWRRFVNRPPKFFQQLIENGYGVMLPLIFGQHNPQSVAEYRDHIEQSYLFTSYNKTLHMHQADDLVTTAKLTETEFGVLHSNLAIVADRGMALMSFVAWAFLCSQTKVGSFAGDFRGLDLTDAATWGKHAYFPLALRSGGIKDFARLCSGRKAFLSGVSAGNRGLFPRVFKLVEQPVDLSGLIKGVEML